MWRMQYCLLIIMAVFEKKIFDPKKFFGTFFEKLFFEVLWSKSISNIAVFDTESLALHEKIEKSFFRAKRLLSGIFSIFFSKVKLQYGYQTASFHIFMNFDTFEKMSENILRLYRHVLSNEYSYFFNICRLIFDENGALKLSRPGDDVQNVQPQQLFFFGYFLVF